MGKAGYEFSDISSAMVRKILLDRYGLLIGYDDLIQLRRSAGHIAFSIGWEGAAVTYLIAYIRLFMDSKSAAAHKRAAGWIRIVHSLVSSSVLSIDLYLRLCDTVVAHFNRCSSTPQNIDGLDDATPEINPFITQMDDVIFSSK